MEALFLYFNSLISVHYKLYRNYNLTSILGLIDVIELMNS